MISSRNTFVYQPISTISLEEFKIQLIRLHPGGFNDCIRCTIYHASIPENPPQTENIAPQAEYIALSYVWGDPRKTEPIRLGYQKLLTSETASTRPPVPSPGADFYKSFQITTNLYTALRYLRDRDSKRILWVDAICINQ
ncbi:hypothetical protein COCCADRAFT_92369, partial [Bipolaris zeicola 26-R-13]